MTERPRRRFLRLRLWHLFALLTVAAVLVWLWPKVGLDLTHRPGRGSRGVMIWRDGKQIQLWDTFPPPAVRDTAFDEMAEFNRQLMELVDEEEQRGP